MVKKIIVTIGDVCVSKEPAVLQTILGSCVSTCLWDEKGGVGGMNHFMLPQTVRNLAHPPYLGPESIEKLVHELLRIGADIHGLRAKLFGGGRVLRGLNQNPDVGKDNVIEARKVLKGYGIPIMKEFTCSDFGIKLIFHTATGRAFLKKLEDIQETVR
jgi:chemotaxis protein CheD